MNIKILLFVIAAASISSCSTAYRNTQTPDDVYYSPARAEDNSRYEQQQQKEEVKNYNREDRQIRMAVYDRRWRDFDDDYNYRYDPYKYGYSCGYYYNPYYCYYPVYTNNVVIVNPKNTVPRMTNLGSYTGGNLSFSNNKFNNTTRLSSQRAYNNSNNSNTFIRRIFTTPSTSTTNSSNTNNSSNNSTESNNTRSYTPSSSSSSGSSGGSSGGTTVTRPARGG